jgi:hypothetical protein
MRFYRSLLILCALLVVLAGSLPIRAQENPPPKNTAPSPANRLTVEITGGDGNKPVENASVYVKTVEQHAIKKDKRSEVNVKTNQDGIAHIPDIPLGRILIQIVADGWKTYGHWYDITDPKQTIQIHLDRPPKWY